MFYRILRWRGLFLPPSFRTIVSSWLCLSRIRLKDNNSATRTDDDPSLLTNLQDAGCQQESFFEWQAAKKIDEHELAQMVRRALLLDRQQQPQHDMIGGSCSAIVSLFRTCQNPTSIPAYELVWRLTSNLEVVRCFHA